MGIIVISRGSYSQGKEVAEKVAARLNYRIISREDLLSSASKEFHIPEVKLLHAIEDAPSFWDKVTYFKDRYILYIETTLLNLVKADNVIYHGFAGHYFLRDIPYILKVRVNADMDIRARFVMQRDKVTKEEAIKTIEKLDNIRKKWSERFYGRNIQDMDLYDVILNITKTTHLDDIVELLCLIASSDPFKTTPGTLRAIDEHINQI